MQGYATSTMCSKSPNRYKKPTTPLYLNVIHDENKMECKLRVVISPNVADFSSCNVILKPCSVKQECGLVNIQSATSVPLQKSTISFTKK